MTRHDRIVRLLRQLDIAAQRGDIFSTITLGARLRAELVG